MSAGETPHSAASAIWNPRGWQDLLSDFWRARELIVTLAYRDIAVRYRHSFLGYLWAFILPVVTVGIFTFLTGRQVLPIGETPLPYPLFALCSLIVWQLFSNVLSACTQSLANAGSLVTRINFPKEALVFGAAGQPLVDFAIKLIPVVVLFLYFGVTPHPALIFMPLVLLPVVLLAIGLGFFLSIANLLTRDVANLVGMFATFGMFAAPVLYPPPVTSPFDLVNVLNPVSPLLIAMQDLLAYGELRHAALFAGGLVFASSIFLFGWRVFRTVIFRVAERA
jgi:lipopolysaccharide transport system permease protein